MKTCFKCKQLKSKDKFSIATGRKDGVCVYCKECTSKVEAKKYSNSASLKHCENCGIEFLGLKNRMICSAKCAGLKRKKLPDGYRTCLTCNVQFGYRLSLKKRNNGLIKNSKAKFCSRICSNKGTAKLNKTVEHRKKVSESLRGSQSLFWKGGVTEENKIIRCGLQYSLWRESVFKRDDFTCRECNQKGGKLNAHHIKPFSLFPELRFAIDNGVTLCVSCHMKTDTWGGKFKRNKLLESFDKYIESKLNK
jgi:hypothetical protein